MIGPLVFLCRCIANELGSYCMLTTHFNELADLHTTAKNVVLSHVTALVGEEGVTFQYTVQPGVCSQSFGINVAQMAGLPSHIIEVCPQQRNSTWLLDFMSGLYLWFCLRIGREGDSK